MPHESGAQVDTFKRGTMTKRKNNYKVLKAFFDAKNKKEEGQKEYREARQKIFDTFGQKDQVIEENDLKVNIFPNYRHKINKGNFAKSYPDKFQRYKELTKEKEKIEQEMREIELLMSQFKYRDIKSGPVSWGITTKNKTD